MVELESTKDLEALRTTAINLDKSLRSLLRENAKLRRENLQLKGLDPEQIELLLKVDMTAPAGTEAGSKSGDGPPGSPDGTKKAPKKPPSVTGRTPQPKLEQKTLDVPLEDSTCPDCEQPIVAFDSWDSSEAVTVTRAVYTVVSERRQKGRCGCPDKVHTAPSQVLKMRSGGRYSVELTAHVAVNKWCDHLPLERQARRMQRAGLDVTPQALSDQTMALAEELRTHRDQVLAELLASPVLGVDETSWKRQRKGGSEYRAIIGLSTPTAAGYIFSESKDTDRMERFLEGFTGTLVCDGLLVYGCLADRRSETGTPITLAHCWAHVFRKFRDASADFPIAIEMMQLIGKLYDVDKRAGPFPGNDEVRRRRKKLRAKHSKKILAQIRRLALKLIDVPKDLTIRDAAAYLLKYWDGLKVFATDPDVPLDNNGCERDLRQAVQGRKNHYGSASERALETASVLYTLIQTCLKLGVDPEKYLVEAVRRRRADSGDIYLPRHALAESLAA